MGLDNQNDGTSIFIAGQRQLQANPLNPDGPQQIGWSNRNNEDLTFACELLAHLRAEYCIDNHQIFSTGWSYGGIMTNRVGCHLAQDIKAIAPVMGQGPESWR